MQEMKNMLMLMLMLKVRCFAVKIQTKLEEYARNEKENKWSINKEPLGWV